MRKERITIIVIVFILTLFTNISTVDAIYSGYSSTLRGSTNCTSNSGGGGDGGGPSCKAGKHKYCNIKVDSATESATLNEDLYDTQGNYIGAGAMLQDKIILTSGRFVGIDAYEEYQKTFYVTMKPECVEGTLVDRVFTETQTCCTKSLIWTCVSYGRIPTTNYYGCTSSTYEWVETCTECKKQVTRTVLECSPCSITPADCRAEAEAELEKQVKNVKWQPSYVGYRQDVNDIREGVDKNGNPTFEVPYSDKIEDLGKAEPSNTNSTRLWRTYTVRYRYNLPDAWINPSTGMIKYENEMKDSEKSTYYKTEPMYIEDKLGDKVYKIKVGKYYIPLNATNDDVIKYYLLPNRSGTAYSKELCAAVISKYSTKSDTKPFWGDFLMHKNVNNKRMIYDDAKTVKAATDMVNSEGGCRMGLRVTLKIAEDFYKTEGGYNYYYRQIDYSQPFPNGMSSNGFWFGRYDAKTNSTVVTNANGKKDTLNSQDLDNSFSKITYMTNSDYNASTIREYNQASNNPKDNRIYSSWLEMNNNGTSSFINAGNGISRNGCQKFYILGCGPANSDWAQCKVTEVCH